MWEQKITGYLLNARHPEGAGKAKFFASLGFSRQDWHLLAAALRRLPETAPVARSMASVHGRKYTVDGPLETPSGRSPLVRTIWIIDRGSEVPRLVTAYPHEGET